MRLKASINFFVDENPDKEPMVFNSMPRTFPALIRFFAYFTRHSSRKCSKSWFDGEKYNSRSETEILAITERWCKLKSCLRYGWYCCIQKSTFAPMAACWWFSIFSETGFNLFDVIESGKSRQSWQSSGNKRGAERYGLHRF